ncbi:hypothetical protein Xoosp13_172 [Xanthomonas phage Xoo-sp13]|nr:hypothetical protein Xoosp13_172 [Xanthomonas phage Xoo-sp13]
MGCWNKTCGITNLPIFHGDEVVVFLLVQSPYTSAMNSYSSGLWNHIPLPIYGKYNDYGWIDPHPGQEWKLDLFKKGITVVRKEPEKTDSGYNRYPNLKDTPFASFEALGNSIHGDVFEVTVNSYTKGKCNVTLAEFFIHKSTFDELKTHLEYDAAHANLEAFVQWNNSKQDSIENVEELQNIIADGVERTDEEYEALLRRITAAIRSMGITSVADTDFHKTLNPVPEYEWSYPGYDAINFWHANGQGSMHGWVTSGFTRTIRNPPTAQGASTSIPPSEMMDGYIVLELMQSLRKSFSPQSGEGSQDGIDTIHKVFADTYLKRIKEYDDTYGYDEEEEEEDIEEDVE